MKRTILVILLALSSANCIPVIAGALIVKSSKSKGQKQEFMSQLQRTNMDREAKGLTPLDWCSEAYRFDKGWAQEDAGCRTRVVAYEKGDTHALETPVLARAAADSVPATPAGGPVPTAVPQ
jgi:hypothetical protein